MDSELFIKKNCKKGKSMIILSEIQPWMRKIMIYKGIRLKNMRKNLVVVGYGGMGGWHAEHALNLSLIHI